MWTLPCTHITHRCKNNEWINKNQSPFLTFSLSTSRGFFSSVFPKSPAPEPLEWSSGIQVHLRLPYRPNWYGLYLKHSLQAQMPLSYLSPVSLESSKILNISTPLILLPQYLCSKNTSSHAPCRQEVRPTSDSYISETGRGRTCDSSAKMRNSGASHPQSCPFLPPTPCSGNRHTTPLPVIHSLRLSG